MAQGGLRSKQTLPPDAAAGLFNTGADVLVEAKEIGSK